MSEQGSSGVGRVTWAVAALLALAVAGCGGAQQTEPSRRAPARGASGVQRGAAGGVAGGVAGGETARIARTPLLRGATGPAGSPHRIALSNKPVTVIAFADFQCPFCARGQATLAQIQDAYPNEVEVIFLHKPLSFHRAARPAALGAIAAAQQGRFWQMHDALFARYRNLNTMSIEAAASEAGVDMDRWQADMRSQQAAVRLAHDIAVSNAVGVRGTPNYFVNGLPVRGAQPYARFEKAVTSALATVRKLEAAGHSGRRLRELAWRAGHRTSGPRLLQYAIDGARVPAGLAATATTPRRRASWLDRRVWNVPVNESSDVIVGNSQTATVTLVVWTDLQCPFCARLQASIDALRLDWPKRLRVVYRNKPLPFHRDARRAAVAALAAHRQGKYAPFVAACFANIRALSAADLERKATQLGLDMPRYRRDVADPAVLAQVTRDMAEAKRLGVRGTPTFFVNGMRVVGAQPLARIRPLVRSQLKVLPAGPAAYAAHVAKGRDVNTP